jgi:hypothetical protein
MKNPYKVNDYSKSIDNGDVLVTPNSILRFTINRDKIRLIKAFRQCYVYYGDGSPVGLKAAKNIIEATLDEVSAIGNEEHNPMLALFSEAFVVRGYKEFSTPTPTKNPYNYEGWKNLANPENHETPENPDDSLKLITAFKQAIISYKILGFKSPLDACKMVINNYENRT